MDLNVTEARMSRVDTAMTPVAEHRSDMSDPGWGARVHDAVEAGLSRDRLGDEAQTALHELIEAYETGGEAVRAKVRELLTRYSVYQWVTSPPWDVTTAEGLRRRLLYWSACDQGQDTRDELLALHDILTGARDAGVEIGPILTEVADLSSDVDKYGMGSTRGLLLRCVPR